MGCYLVFGKENLVTNQTEYQNISSSQQFYPIYLNKTNDSKIPVNRYRNDSIPPQLKNSIDYIDFQLSNKTYAQVLIYFTRNPGSVNGTLSNYLSDFITHRPEWKGNVSSDSVAASIYMGWAQETIRYDPFLKYVYPYYLVIFERNKAISIHPLRIPYWYSSKNSTTVSFTHLDLPPIMQEYISSISYETNNKTNGQVYIYFSDTSRLADWSESSQIADFIMNKPEWVGDRSRFSVISEIYLHWVAENIKPFFERNSMVKNLYVYYVIGSQDNRTSPIDPIHLGYYYEGLGGTPVMDPILERI
jgi:hypothetical protein